MAQIKYCLHCGHELATTNINGRDYPACPIQNCGYVFWDNLNLPQFNGHFKKYTDGYTMKKKGVSDEQAEAEVQQGV